MSASAFQRVLSRHKDDDPPRLKFEPPLDRLMDEGHCAQIMADLEEVAPDGWEVIPATPTAWRKLPADTGLYMFVWAPKLELRLAEPVNARKSFPWILYVGQAGGSGTGSTLKSRYRKEYAGLVGGDLEILWSSSDFSRRKERLNRFLSLVPIEYWFCVVKDTERIGALESQLYNLLAPPLNERGGRRLRPVGKIKRAF